ncbi:hypothetical protein B9R80_002406 [Salmonella enterica]|nr:hypothetical protein [Salmonella enterica]
MATGIDAHRVATRLGEILQREFHLRLITRVSFEHDNADMWRFDAHTDKQNAEIRAVITPETYHDTPTLTLWAASLYDKLTEF